MTTSDGWHLAQANIARLKEPIDSPTLAGFVTELDPVNALADGSPGFVWRLQSDEGNATSIRAFDDDRIIVNISVWTSLEALRAFVFEGRHLDVLRRRREWVEKLDGVSTALWWVRPGTIPTVEDAKAKLALLAERGSSTEAFTFREPFAPPSAEPSMAPVQPTPRP